jgi:hypothetical protein
MSKDVWSDGVNSASVHRINLRILVFNREIIVPTKSGVFDNVYIIPRGMYRENSEMGEG